MKITAKWQRLFDEHLPGYDPMRGCDPFTFDAAAADEIVDFFPTCLEFIEGEVAGQPFALEPWESAILGCAFGWKRADGTRRYREVFVEVPRKNNKTPLSAGVLAYVMFMDHEPGAQLYSAAFDRDQAALIYRHMAGMIQRSPALSKRVRCYRTFKSIEYPAEGTTYKALARGSGKSEGGAKHGFNVHFAVLDEVHTHPTREQYDLMKTGMISRRQPMLWSITTSDYEHEGSICNELEDRAKSILDGHNDDPFFLPVLYKLAPDDDWEDEANWKRVNPNWGKSVKSDYFREQFIEAKRSPTYENTFKRLHLNIRTEQAVRWIQMDRWDACRQAVSLADFHGQPCMAALDLGSTRDLTALTLMFERDNKYFAFSKFWIGVESMRVRVERDHVPYDVWVRDGLMTTTPGDSTDYGAVRLGINALVDGGYGIRTLAVDRLFQGAQLCGELREDGIDVVAFGQGFLSMTAPTKRYEELILDGDYVHDGNPIKRWMAANAVVETNASESMKVTKKLSSEKVDGIVTDIMALAMCTAAEEPEASVYSERGLLVL